MRKRFVFGARQDRAIDTELVPHAFAKVPFILMTIDQSVEINRFLLNSKCFESLDYSTHR